MSERKSVITRILSLGLKAKLLGALAAIVICMLLVTGLANKSLMQFSTHLGSIVEKEIPNTVQTLTISKSVSELVGLGAQITSAKTEAELNKVVEAYKTSAASIHATQDALSRTLSDADKSLLQDEIEASLLLVENLIDSMREHLKIENEITAARTAFEANVDKIGAAIAPVIDDNSFNLSMGLLRSSREGETAEGMRALSTRTLPSFKAAYTIQIDTNVLNSVLAQLADTHDAAYLIPVADRYNTALARIKASLDILAKNDMSNDVLKEGVAKFTEFADPQKGLFSLQRSAIESDANLEEISNYARAEITRFSEIVQKLVDANMKNMNDANAELTAGVAETQHTLIMLTVVSGLIAAFLGLYYINRRIVGTMLGLVASMKIISDGNYKTVVGETTRRDELGEMARAIEIFRSNGEMMDEMRQEQEALRVKADKEKKVMQQKLASDFEAAVSGVVRQVADSAVSLKGFAEILTKTAEETSQQATSVAVTSQQASGNVSTVAAASEELSASISEISRQVQESSSTARAAVEEAKSTNTTVASMAQAAQKIGDVVQLISEIANQTNLLALNATIEAARAGEAGKGFAVVASEVKNLASQTAKATEEITAQISAMQGVAGEAVKAIQGISTTIERINGISSAIAAAVEEQGAATAEISRNVQEASQGTNTVTQNIGSVTTAAAETGQVSGQVLTASSELEREAARLQNEVNKFIKGIREA